MRQASHEHGAAEERGLAGCRILRGRALQQHRCQPRHTDRVEPSPARVIMSGIKMPHITIPEVAIRKDDVAALLNKDGFDPTRWPAAKLWGHILQKGWQAGSLLGVAGVAPGLQAWSVFVSKEGNIDGIAATEGVAYGALAGLALTGIVGTLKFLQMDREGLQDRVYRLHHNSSQHRTDLFAGVGGAVGVAAAAYLLPKYYPGAAAPLNYVGAAAAGSAAGLLVHMVTRPSEYTSPTKMLHELRH